MRMAKRYDELAGLFSLFSNPIRLKILDTLINKCMENGKKRACVIELNDELRLPQPYISKHLKIIRDAGVLSFRKEGNKVYYSFADNNSLQIVFDYMQRCCKCCKGKNQSESVRSTFG